MFSENPQDFMNNSSMCIHAVSSEGVIVYANQCELDVLGYEKEEYIGHLTSEFHIDKHCSSDILERLGRFEPLNNYPARVKGKKGVIYIIYNSSVYEKNGVFVHTRCYGTEVEKPIYAVYLQQHNRAA